MRTMTEQFLSLRDVAEETGIAHGTLKTWTYRQQWDRLPEPDVKVGLGDGQRTVYGWSRSTIDAWTAQR